MCNFKGPKSTVYPRMLANCKWDITKQRVSSVCWGISMLSKSVRLAAGQRVGLPSGLSPFLSLCVGHCVRLCIPSVFFCPPSCLASCWSLWVIVSVLSPFCFLLSPFLSPFLLVIVFILSPFCFLLSPFLLVTVSAFSSFLSPTSQMNLGMLLCCPTCRSQVV